MKNTLILLIPAALIFAACEPALPIGDSARERCASLDALPDFPRPEALSDLTEIRVDYQVEFANLDGSPVTEALYIKLPDDKIHRLKLDKQSRLPRAGDVLFAPPGSALCRATLSDTPLQDKIDTSFHSFMTLRDQTSALTSQRLRRAADEADYVSRLIAGGLSPVPPMDHVAIRSSAPEKLSLSVTAADGSSSPITPFIQDDLAFIPLAALERQPDATLSISPAPEAVMIAFAPFP